MTEVYTNPLEANDTNEANLKRVFLDSQLERTIREALAEQLAREPEQSFSVIQMDMDKSVHIRKRGIAYKLRILEGVNALLRTFSDPDCQIIPHGTRDDVTILRKMQGGPEDEVRFVQQVLETVAATSFGELLDGGPFQVTYSAGLSFYPFHGKTAEQLLSLADGAVRWAKDHGRNTWAMAECGYAYVEEGLLDSARWDRMFRISCKTGKSMEELLREGYEAIFEKHSALYRFCCQEEWGVDGDV